MENRFDHMEDSVQKAFEGFELPVNDTDWANIANALDKEPTHKPAGFIYWFKKNLRFGLLLIALTIATSVGLIWQVINTNSINKVPNQDRITQQAATADRTITNNPASGGAKTRSGDITSTTPSEIATTTNRAGTTKTAASADPVMGGANKLATKVTNLVEIKQPEPQPITPEPIALIPENKIPLGLGLMAFGIRNQTNSLLLEKAAGYPLANTILPTNKPKINPWTLSYFTSLNTTFAPGKVSNTSTPGIWEGFQWLGGSNPTLDLRLDGGMEIGSKNFKFTMGGALEGNPMHSKSTDTIRIKVATHFLPYQDINGNVLYWLAIKWRDSTILVSRNPQRVWAEIPLGIKKNFKAAGDLSISTAITLNPGVLLGNKSSIANPYMTQAGSYWSYMHGINPDTTSAIIDASEFLNPLRMGTGIQLGIEKEMGALTWGLNVQSRYYFTPVWKTGVPLKQNTLQYGINLRLGFKL